MKTTQRNVLFNGEEMYDQSHRAGKVLEHVLDKDAESQEAQEEVDIAVERSARPIIDQTTNRTASRILFVTSDISVLTSESELQNEYISLSGYFDEVHVLVLVNRKGKNDSIRCSDRTWVYSVYDTHWWRIPFSARKVASERLVFNENIRPDVVVGADPYEAGLSALKIAQTFNRPLQIHVPDDFTQSAFLDLNAHNVWRRRIAKYVLKRTKSVRAKTYAVKEMLHKNFKRIIDLEVLPKFYNFSGYLSAQPSFDLHDTYKDYVFIILTFGPLTADSYLHDVFASLHQTLHNPRIGLIVIGDGPAKDLFKEKVAILGIEQNVIFKSSTDDLISHYKTADVLVEVGTTRESEEHIMRSAAAGLPIIAVETELRNDLFKDGHSAFLCAKEEVQCIGQRLTKFLNSPALRKQFARQGEQITRDRLIENPESYYRAYRDTIEVILSTDVQIKDEMPINAKRSVVQAEESRTEPILNDGLNYPTQQVP